jgi:hypothetical protein
MRVEKTEADSTLIQRGRRVLAEHLSSVVVGTVSSALGGLILFVVPSLRNGVWNLLVGQWELCIAVALLFFAAACSLAAWHWKMVASVAVSNAARFEAAEAELEDSKKEITRLREQVDAVDRSRPVELPDNNHLFVFRALLNAGAATGAELAEEVGQHYPNVKEYIKALRLHYGYVQRIRYAEDGEPVYELTEEGQRYADFKNWKPATQAIKPNVAADGYPTAKGERQS